jgi:uncharacterized protein (TIGR03083 family)
MDIALACDAREMADIYRDTEARIRDVLIGSGPAAWQCPVAACPGWSVRDVVSHLTAVAQDWVAGALSGAPTDEQTAEHVRRFADRGEEEILEAWSQSSDRLRHLSETVGLEPPLGDIASHEHDIRSALGRPGARDARSVRWTSDRLLTLLQTPVPLRVVVEDGQYRSGPADGIEIELQTTRFEAMRWRTGRRSPAQLAAMNWSADPTPVLDHLYIFGPAGTDIEE